MRYSDRSGKAQRGFTLVEVLALAAGLVLLTAVTLPAVQQVREDARSEQCRNNLKQMGLAIHNYHDVYNMFPPGWVTRRQEGAGHLSSGWPSALLPYVDQAPLYNQLERNSVYESRDQFLLKQSIPAYRCPVDSLGATNVLRGGWGTSNYLGNYGAAPIARWSGSFSNDLWPGQSLTPQMSGQPYASQPALNLQAMSPNRSNQRAVAASFGIRPSGVFFMNRGAGFRDITDGTSNTFLIGERSAFGGGGIWPGPRSNFHESDVVADASYASPLNGGTPGFSGRHRGVVNFVICDGSVRPINENVESSPDFGTLQRLASRNDGLPVQSR